MLEEGGVKMKLTVIDSPGFGDQINNDNWWVLTRASNTGNWGYFNQKVATDLTVKKVMSKSCLTFAVICFLFSETSRFLQLGAHLQVHQ